jgi:hypothetical protein
MGRYPFYCGDCGHHFFAARRYPPAKGEPSPAQSPAAGPDMALRRHAARPTAQVVIQADDHVQLDRILLALHSAVTSYQNATPHSTVKASR